jgi:hypothetical protein
MNEFALRVEYFRLQPCLQAHYLLHNRINYEPKKVLRDRPLIICYLFQEFALRMEYYRLQPCLQPTTYYTAESITSLKKFYETDH